jgi:hypothetical protein
MSEIFNIYCDESCHLEHDGLRVMVLGAVWCPLAKAHEIALRMGEIKSKHGFPKRFEIKWTKVSPAKLAFYMEVLDYFFEERDLHFRALIVADKSKLDHEAHHQDHDTWYYKMYFTVLKTLFGPHDKYRIYLDVKDTRSAEKIRKLHDVLCNNMYDFDKEIITHVQTVRSHEVEQIQLADLLTGAVGYANRGLETNSAKVALVKHMQDRSHYSLTRTTLFREDKVNIFRWEGREVQA